MDARKENIVKIITVSMIIFICLLSVALIINLVKLGKTNARLSDVAKATAEVESQIDANGKAIDTYSSDEWIDNQAREYYGMYGSDEEVFIGEEG